MFTTQKLNFIRNFETFPSSLPLPPSSFTKGRAGTSWLHSEQELYYFSPAIHFVSLTTPPATPTVSKTLNCYFHQKACCSCTCVPYDTILIKQWTLLCLLLHSFRIYTFKFVILFSALINVYIFLKWSQPYTFILPIMRI